MGPTASPAGTIILLAVIVAVIAGVVWAVRGRGLLAAIVLFASLAVALLVGALAAAHVPDLLFNGEAPKDTDGAWKAAQTIVLSLGFVGIVVTGVVGYHRQRIAQQQAEQDRDRLGLDRRTRQHERFAKGSEMLAADAPEMRIAGLNVIAALAAEVDPDDELRQTCINLICAYLRKNSPVDQGSPVPAHRAARSQRAADLAVIGKYRAVTEEACRLLPTLFEATHDTPDDTPKARYRLRRTLPTRSTALDLDLRNTTLIDIDFRRRVIGDARFQGTRFSGIAVFAGATFSGHAVFEGAAFSGDAVFARATFSGDAGFRAAAFSGDAVFARATFSGEAWFRAAAFSGDAVFEGATISGEAEFREATFSGKARFGGTTFSGDAVFDRATFSGEAWFREATFSGGVAWFGGARFSQYARFDRARFSRLARFDRARFSRYVLFDEATFFGDAGFGGAKFSWGAHFQGARFVSYDNAHHDDLKDAVFVTDPEHPFPGALYGPAPEELGETSA